MIGPSYLKRMEALTMADPQEPETELADDASGQAAAEESEENAEEEEVIEASDPPEAP